MSTSIETVTAFGTPNWANTVEDNVAYLEAAINESDDAPTRRAGDSSSG